MGIQALPQTTVRALGANQVLTNPASVVKELIDNSIDANATSITVEIHNNTLDIIQVRDNGRGVPPEDRPLVARRYCTSKIAHDDDLKDIGGSSLGFRGEALASAAELSSSLTISTRIEGETVAVALKIDQKGEVTTQDRVSHPVGTTVRIADFIKSNPVRKQVALKNTESCLGTIKHTLQSYSLARPHIRFSLRVLKSKAHKGDWVYAPKADSNAADAAIKVLGSACASQCTWSVLEEGGFTFQAFLPRPDAEACKISNVGCFMSVDHRPVSSARGTLKQIAKTFRDAVKKASPDLENVKDPFLYLEISCPRGVYDANIEPAKDDVLFEEPSVVVAGARKLFAAVYEASAKLDSPEEANDLPGSIQLAEHMDEPNVSPEFTNSGPVQHQPERSDQSVTNSTMMAMQEPWDEEEIFMDARENQADQQPTFRTNMYGFDEEDLDLLDVQSATGRAEENVEELRQVRKDANLTNPFILAKLHGGARRPAADYLQSSNDTHDLPTYLSSSPTKPSSRHVDARQAALPTPRPSSPSPPLDDVPQPWHAPDIVPSDHYDGYVSISQPAPHLQTPAHSDWTPAYDDRNISAARLYAAPAYNYDLTADTETPSFGTPLEAIPDSITRPRRKPQTQSNINRPFVPPSRAQPDRDKVWFDFPQPNPRRQRKPRVDQPNHGLVTQGELGDLVDDPRPLTPPRRNRDIRSYIREGEIVGSRTAEIGEDNIGHQPKQRMGWNKAEGLGKDGEGQTQPVQQVMRRGTAGLGHNAPKAPVSALIKNRNYGRARAVPEDVSGQENQPAAEEEHQQPVSNSRAIGGRDFVSAAEVAALQAYCSSSPEKQAFRPPKRPRTSERRALRESSTNAPVPAAGEEEQTRPATSSDRRRSRLRKSSRLPLETVPPDQYVCNVVLTQSTAPNEIARMAGKIDDDNSLLGYNQPAVGVASIFSSDALDLYKLSSQLHNLLIKDDTDAPVPEHRHLLSQELRNAFSKHAQDARDDGDDEVMSSA